MNKEVLIAMQENLGMGHGGRILITTQRRVDTNQEPIARDIHRDYAIDICRRWNSQPDLLKACEAYIRHCELHDSSEHPKANMFCTECPRYRKQIEAAVAKAQPSKQSVEP